MSDHLFGDSSELVDVLWVGLLAVPLLATAACGPDEPAESCATNADCEAGQICTDGTCGEAPDTGVEDGSDGGRDAGGCYPHRGSCVRQECDGGDGCRTVTCPIDCKTWKELDGCTCVRRSCTNSDDCYGYACSDGECRPCEGDEDCEGEKVCHPSGKCLSGEPCDKDEDCSPRKRCSDRGECVDRDECLVDDDCSEDEICFNGQCQLSPDCMNDSDCGEGLECVGGSCFEKVCRGPDDCAEDEFCSAGDCIEAQTASSCFVATPDQKITQNSRIRLKAYAVDQNGNGVAASFQWSSDMPSVAKIGSSGTRAVGGSSSGTATITAKLDDGSGTKCKGEVKLTNLGTVPSGNLRVVVTSAKSRSPVSGADVVIQGAGTAQTNNSGVATLSKPNGSYTVSVFHKDYNYLTVKGLSASDIRLPLTKKEGTGPVAGFTGKFDKSKLNTQGDITLGLAGSSITGGLLEVGLEQLLGRPVVRSIQTPQGSQDLPLPAGLVFFGKLLGFNLDVKKKYFATSPGGVSIGWGLAGEVPGNRLFQLFQGGLDNPLATLLPLFNRFDHAARPLQLTAKPRVTDSGDFDGDGDTSEKIPDYQNFPNVSLQPSVRQNLVTAVTVSNFPKLPSGTPDFAVLVGGNLQSSAGMVPLGISATTDDDDDGTPDLRNLSMAPPHGAISGGRYVVMALAFQAGALSPQGGLTLPNNFSAALWTRKSLAKKVGLGAFPDASSGTVDQSGRTIDVSSDAGPLYRFQFVGQTRTWELWTKGSSSSMGSYQHTAQIPSISGSRTDLFANNSLILVDAIEAQVNLDDVAKATGVGLRRVGRVASAFNRTEL